MPSSNKKETDPAEKSRERTRTAQRIREVLRQHGGRSISGIQARLKDVRAGVIRKVLQRMPDAYIESWGPRSSQSPAIWNVVTPPPNARKPSADSPDTDQTQPAYDSDLVIKLDDVLMIAQLMQSGQVSPNTPDGWKAALARLAFSSPDAQLKLAVRRLREERDNLRAERDYYQRQLEAQSTLEAA